MRWNCKAGRCGSCSAEINGKPSLMCMTRMTKFPEGEPITVTPMRSFPVIKDLVTDVERQLRDGEEDPAVQAAAASGRRDATGCSRRTSIASRSSGSASSASSARTCATSSATTKKTNFAGPRFLIYLAGLDMHPLDTLDRRELIKDEFKVGLCNITKCCTEVCPEHIHITDNGIIPLKERVADDYYDPVRWLLAQGRRRAQEGEGEAARSRTDDAATTRPRRRRQANRAKKPAERVKRSGGMSYSLKRLPRASLDAALAKAAHYRDLNQPEEAESICRDVLDVDARNQRAWKLLGLALTDRFPTRQVGLLEEAIEAFERLDGRVRARLPPGRRVGARGQGAPRAQRGAQRGHRRSSTRSRSSRRPRACAPTRRTPCCAGTAACGCSRAPGARGGAARSARRPGASGRLSGESAQPPTRPRSLTMLSASPRTMSVVPSPMT